MRIIDISVVILLVGVAITTTYSIHSDYHLLYHSDEWDHLAFAKNILKTGHMTYSNPYSTFGATNTSNREIDSQGGESTPPWQSAYHLLLAILISITGMEGYVLGYILPTIVAFLMSLNVFALVAYLTGKHIPALLSAILALTIKSNVTFLGPWFLVPMALGMAQLPLLILVFLRLINSNSLVGPWELSFIALLANTTFSSPQSVVVFGLIALVYLILSPKVLWANKWKFCIIGVLGALVLFLSIVPLGAIAHLGWYMAIQFPNKSGIFSFGDVEDNYRVVYFLPRHLGQIILSLSIIGTYSLLMNKNVGGRILPFGLLALLPLLTQFYQTNEILILPYRRAFIHTYQLLLIISGVGAYHVYSFISYVEDKIVEDEHIKKIVKLTILVLIFWIVLGQIPTSFRYKEMLYRTIEEKDVAPLLWVREKTPRDAIILAQPHVSKAVTPVAERRVVATVRTRVGSDDATINEVYRFFDANCDDKVSIAKKFNADYVFSQAPISCPSLDLVHAENGDYIYVLSHDF